MMVRALYCSIVDTLRAFTTAGIAAALTLAGCAGTTPVGKADGSPAAAPSVTCRSRATEMKVPQDRPVPTPPPTAAPKQGLVTMRITTDLGVIDIEVDRAKTPCTAGFLHFIAESGFYDDTSCHRLTTEGIFILQCGDPTGEGDAGPGFEYGEENVPTTAPGEEPPDMVYQRGTVAMARTEKRGTNGSQFFLVYRDSELPAGWTPFGVVKRGIGIIDEVAAGGEGPSDMGMTRPLKQIKIISIRFV